MIVSTVSQKNVNYFTGIWLVILCSGEFIEQPVCIPFLLIVQVYLDGTELIWTKFILPYLGHLGKMLNALFSSPEPKAPGELIGWEGSIIRPSTISNDFSSETAGPIATKFHIQPPGPLGKKSCSNGLGHMTNMAAMPIYGKNLKKSFSPEPLDR